MVCYQSGLLSSLLLCVSLGVSNRRIQLEESVTEWRTSALDTTISQNFQMLHMLASLAIFILMAYIRPGSCAEDVIMDELDKNTLDGEPQPDSGNGQSQMLDESAKEIYRKLLKVQQGGQLVTRKEYLKKDWCKAEPIVHKIREAGCIPNTVINRFCYGQCNSFYIPGRSGRRRRSEVDFRSCAACRPSLANWITISLSCPDADPPHKTRRVYRVKRCKCVAHDFL